jgi:hypothetical protein
MIEQEDTQDSIVMNRARSNYSERHLKDLVVQKKYGETKAHYLWRLLRVFIRKTIDAVSKSDVEGLVLKFYYKKNLFRYCFLFFFKHRTKHQSWRCPFKVNESWI